MNTWLKRFYDASPVLAQNVLLSAFSWRLDHQRYGGRFAEFRELLEGAQWWDRDRMGRWQDERLRQLVRHANDHVPYYRELFAYHGIDVARFDGRGDLRRIPFLTRDIVKTRLQDLRSRHPSHRKLAEGHTSGTTGSPLTVYYDADMMAMSYAALDRQYRWAGVRLEKDGDRVAIIRGNVIVPLSQSGPPYWRHNYVHNHLLLSNFHLSPSTLPDYLRALVEFRPAVLDGYPSSVFVLATLLLRLGKTLPLKAVLTSSETLFDFQREAIEQAFECRVFDYFGAAERVIFSVECDRHQGHHSCQEYGLTEILDDSGRDVPPGEEGVLVGTTLHNFGFPLIRYRTTDRTSWKTHDCACGRYLPLLEDVTTKAEDLLRLRDGRLISPSVLTHPFKPLDSIDSSQLVQTDLDRLLIRIVPRPGYTEAHSDHLVSELKERLGQDMRIDIELVDALPRTASGKFKWVVSQVDLGL